MQKLPPIDAKILLGRRRHGQTYRKQIIVLNSIAPLHRILRLLL